MFIMLIFEHEDIRMLRNLGVAFDFQLQVRAGSIPANATGPVVYGDNHCNGSNARCSLGITTPPYQSIGHNGTTKRLIVYMSAEMYEHVRDKTFTQTRRIASSGFRGEMWRRNPQGAASESGIHFIKASVIIQSTETLFVVCVLLFSPHAVQTTSGRVIANFWNETPV